MARKLQPVTKLPTRHATPSRLSSAVGKSERDMLVILRRKLAGELDKPHLPPSALAPLIRQFREINSEIRRLDMAAAQLAAGDGDDYDDEDAGNAFGRAGCVAFNPDEI
ncbi:MAG: hypothetical protein ACLP3C_15585 [Mycobacterium sp.]|uniref:hypothetical protein n=1 Tax=Mycobacterium sp. TaxID=1785 RepID=UPI003F96B2BC